jgi:2'-5' RNA ligase
VAEDHTGGMVALVPDDAGLKSLAVDAGDPPERLHLTLAYLGDDVTTMPDATREKLLEDMRGVAARVEPLELDAFAHAAFNPNGDQHDPCAVYLFNGEDVGTLKDDVRVQASAAMGALFPDQHANFYPHVTAGYDLDASTLDFTGPVRFTTLRVALGNDVHDFPLGGDVPEDIDDTGEGTVPKPELDESTGVPVTFKVLIVEGMETSDGRFIEPGSLGHRALPLPILAQTRNPEGGDGHAGAEVIGRLDTLTRVPGPEVTSKETGKPFPEGTFIWQGTGVVDPDANGTKLALKGYLTGNSADLSDVEAEFVFPDAEEGAFDPTAGPEQIRMVGGKIAATTLVPIPAFADAYVEFDGAEIAPADDIDADTVVASAWRAAELGDACLPCSAGVSVTASAEPVAPMFPPLEIFADPQLEAPTPLTIDDESFPGFMRVFGHLAAWNTCHTGFAGQCITPPKSPTDYAYFHVGAVRALADDGVAVDVPVGHITMGEGGHASTAMSAAEAAAHYDDVNTVVSDIAVGEDVHGVWFSGLVRRTATPEQVHALRAAPLSGDWRNYGAGLELVAALAVNTPGFPIPRVRVASGAPSALVAAGVVAQVEDANPTSVEGRDFEALADAIVERMRAAGVGVPKVDAELVTRMASARRTFSDDVLALVDELDELDASDVVALKRKNWVEKAGGLPPYIKRIEKHLEKKGMPKSQAIATAVNAAKKMCKTGDTNFPGKQDINPGSKAEACAAVADWERKKAAA